VREIREVQTHKIHFGTPAAFSLAVIAVIGTAIALSSDWPAIATPVPLTACYLALGAATLNLINELFGSENVRADRGNVDGGIAVENIDQGVTAAAARRLSTVYFAWLVAFLLTIWLIGFLPAMPLFVFAYMHFGFREPALPSAGYAAGTVLLCWGLFDRILSVHWPNSLLGDMVPALRALVGFI
jgi:hypothetical protein